MKVGSETNSAEFLNLVPPLMRQGLAILFDTFMMIYPLEF